MYSIDVSCELLPADPRTKWKVFDQIFQHFRCLLPMISGQERISSGLLPFASSPKTFKDYSEAQLFLMI